MATANPIEIVNFVTDVISFLPAADLSAKTNYFVKISDDMTVAAITGATDLAEGVLKNKPVPTTGPSLVAQVQIRGVVRVITGTGGLAAGDLVTIDSSGAAVKLDPDVGDAYAYGKCIFAGDEGYVASVRLFECPCYVPAPAGE